MEQSAQRPASNSDGEKDRPVEAAKAQAPVRQGKGTDASTPVNHLIWKGQKLPCLVRAAVFQNGLAACVGIKSQDDAFMAGLLKDPDVEPLIRDLVRKQIDVEFSRREISSGIVEDEVLGAIDDFVKGVRGGTGMMGTRKVAEGQAPVPGVDGKRVYVLHPNGEPLHRMMAVDRKVAKKKVHRVKPGDVLVERHPPQIGTEGVDVRGEVVAVADLLDVSLENVQGSNTEVQGDKVVAAIEGVYREDDQGRVQVVQEVLADEVNASTGNLPRTGVATSNFWIKQGIRQRQGVFTTGDVFIGQVRAPAVVDKNTQVNARHLIVQGQVAGGGVPKEFLNGETDALEESVQAKIRHTLEQSQIDVQGIFVAHEVMGRNISAEQIFISSTCLMSSLDAGSHIGIDGDLVGGVTTFGGWLRVLGDLGNAQGTQTRIRIGGQPREDVKKARLDQNVAALKAELEKRTEKLDAHTEEMDRKAKKSAYWQALMQGEKRVPQGPTERALLMVFAKAVKEKNALERAVADGKREIEDVMRLQAEAKEEAEASDEALSIAIKGKVHPGVSIETIMPLEADDLERKVCLSGKDATPIGDLKRDLTQRVTDYLEPRKEQVAAREEALEQMFKDRENKPTMPTVANRRFEVGFQFVADAAGEENAGLKLPVRGVLLVYALEPQNFYLKHIWMVQEPLKNVAFVVTRDENTCSVTYTQNATPLTAWKTDAEIGDQLEAIEIQGVSARTLMFGQ